MEVIEPQWLKLLETIPTVIFISRLHNLWLKAILMLSGN